MGVFAKSAAMLSAAPRKNAKGLRTILPWRIGISVASRPTLDCCSNRNGSGRVSAARQVACELREQDRLSRLPIAYNSARDGWLRVTGPIGISVSLKCVWLIGL